MKQNNTVITLALLGVLALAAVAGGLLPSGNVVHAAAPVFVSGASDRSVPENTPPGVNIGEPISATDGDEDGAGNDDIEFGDTLTYSLSGTDAASFDIDSSTGQLITKAPLDYEDVNNRSYTVVVTVDDDEDRTNPVTQAVTILVTPVSEAPGALAAPTVVATDTPAGTDFELKVIWYAPDDPGDGVTGYDVEYKKSTAVSFTDHDHTGTTTSATITRLDDDTSYQVRVRAKDGNNASDVGPWSLSSAGSTNKEDNDLPTFVESDPVTRTVLENAEPALVVGFPVSATDTDNELPLTYRLYGPDADSFDLHSTTGQIRTKRGVTYDFETKSTLSVTVTVTDGQGGSDARAVTISVTDVPEVPATPARPTVRATPKSSASLDVTWSEPENMGPSIIGYDVRYRKGGDDGFEIISLTGTGTTYTIAPTGDAALEPGTSYEVYVRAKNGEIISQWSAAGTGRTSIGNSEPTFDDRPNLDRDGDGNLVPATTTRIVAENTREGQAVGSAVRAVDGNGDRRAYRLVAADGADEPDVNKFNINESTGQIQIKEPLNHEDVDGCEYDDAANPTLCTYTVKVQVWDGRDDHRNEQDTSTISEAIIDDEITVTITVSDVDEKPAAPTVTVTSPVNGTSLVVRWDVPTNPGPPITDYRLECTGHEVPDEQCPMDIATTTVTDGVVEHTITGLTAFKSYRVRVRADNDEDDGTWSSWTTQLTNKDGNSLPAFPADSPTTLYVQEDAPSARQPVTTDETGTLVVALQEDTAAGDGDSTTFRLEGRGAGRFEIDRGGQIRTKSKLNHEDPECGYNDGANPTSCSYSVRVKLSDPNGGSTFHALTINVTDKEEPPAKPSAPRVTATSGSGWSLVVTWNAPRNDGPPITGYQIRYRKVGEDDWEQWEHTGTSRTNKITTIPDDTNTDVHLEPSTQYEVQVRALNGEGDSTFADATNWSTSGRGTTGASNRRPTFGDTMLSLITREVGEDTRSGQNIGSAIEATDPDGNRLTYTLEGPGKDSFTITSTGQIRTRAALNHEERSSYSVTVKVNDGQRKDNSVAAQSVSITVLDRPETPTAPRAPTVSGVPGSTDSVRVTWDEPANPGPPITHYSVQYAVSGSRDAFDRVMVPRGSADKSVIITGLTSGTRYNVQVRAESPEGHSDWSRSGTGSPNPDVANRNPAFSGGALTFSVAENTRPSNDVGSLIAALDPDGDVLTYILEGIDADSFDIIATNGAGQIQTKAALNHEQKSSYSVAVRVRDGRGGTDAVNVTIRVTDVDEVPDTPFAPTVTTASSASLSISWDAPDNTGPPITDYDYRYRAVSDSAWTEVTNTSITTEAVTIERLTPSTSYDVEVRAKSAEGTSDWSNPGNGSTAAPGANSPPVFAEGQSATRSVSASAPTGTSIGLPVAATDADSGDTLTYSLEGRDAASFAINETSGQLLTKSGVTLIAGETYTVTVAADDTRDIARITVSIESTAAPPNRAPVFSGGPRSFSVREDAAPGTSIGSPVRATDADQGDTLTHSLEGTDAASFSIVASSGQIRTLAALDADTKSTYSVTVRAADTRGGSATIAVTITVTPRPTTFGCATRGAVSDASNTGLVADCEALLAARDNLDKLENGERILNWSARRTITDWDGVYLDGTPARVTRVILRAKGLSGTVPAELGGLPMLTELNLRSNNLTGNIPAELGRLSRLEKLLLHDNQLSGAIPNLSGLRNLEMMWLSGRDMNLTGGVPTWLNSMSGLESLSLWGNNLGDNGTRSIPNLTGMTSLSLLKLQSNNLTGGIPTWLGQMQSLRGLYIHANPLGGTIPRELGNLTRLRRMWLHSSNLTGTIPPELANMANLDTLNLRGNGLTGSIPTELGRLSGLLDLLLHDNQLTGGIPSVLGDLSSLRRLWLSENRLTGGIPTQLGRLPSLEHLNLHTNDLSGAIPLQLGALGDTLTRLRLGAAEGSRANTGLTGCVPRPLAGATDVGDLSRAGSAGLSICP